MREVRRDEAILDLAIKQNVVGFNCSGLDSSTFHVYPIDGAWPVDSGPNPIEVEVVVSQDGYSWGTVSGKFSNLSAAGFVECDHGKNAWIGLRVVTPGGTFPSSPKQIQVEWVGFRVY